MYNHPRFDDFQELVPPAGEKHYINFGDPRFIALMELNFNYTLMKVQIDPDYRELAGQVGSLQDISEIQLHFIKMDEFSPLVEAIDRNKIPHAVVFTDEWAERDGTQTRGVVIIDNGTIC